MSSDEEPARPDEPTRPAAPPALESLDTQALAGRGLAGELVAGVADGAAPLSGQRIGPYRLEGELGRGGMGVVYLGREDGTGRAVAVKVMARALATREALDRFDREVRLVANLEHEAIIRVLSVGDVDGVPYYAMERVEGTTVADQVRSGGASPRWVAALGATVASGLAHAHKRGVIHRDIKPSNLLLPAAEGAEPDPRRVRIADFGLARELEAPRQTVSGAVLGTPLYMAPEQASGEGQVDTRSDLYALGATLYELLTGRPPFEADSFEALRNAHRERTPIRPRRLEPRVPADLDRVVMALLAPDPAHRYQTADEVALDLEAVLEGRPVRATRPSLGYHLWRFAARNRALVSVAVTLLIAGLAFAAWFVRDLDQRRRAAELAEAQTRAREVRTRALLDASRRRRAAELAQLGLLHFEQHAYDRAELRLAEALAMGAPETPELRWRRWAARRLLPPGSQLVDPDGGWFTSVALAPDGTRFASGTSRGWGPGSERRQPLPGGGQLSALHWLADGSLLVGRGYRPWVTYERLPGAGPTGEPARLTRTPWLAVDPAGRMLAWTAGQALWLREVDQDTPARARLRLHPAERASLAGPGLPLVLSTLTLQGVRGAARVVDPASGRTLRALALHPGCRAAISPDGKQVAYTQPGPRFVVESSTRAPSRVRPLAYRVVMDGRWSADGRRFLAVERDTGLTRLVLWDMARRANEGVVAPALRPHTTESVFALSSDGSRLSAVAADGRLLVRPSRSPGQRVISRLPLTRERLMTFGAGHRLVAVLTRDGNLIAWPAVGPLAAEPLHRRGVRDVIGTPEGLLLLLADQVAHWPLGAPAPTRRYAVPAGQQAALLADGGLLLRRAGGGYERRSATGETTASYALGAAEAKLYVASRCGRQLIELLPDSSLRRLQLDAGRVAEMTVDAREMSSGFVAFARGGRELLMTSSHRRLKALGADGAARFDQPVPSRLRGLADGGAAVLLIGNDGLHVHDAADGRPLYTAPDLDGTLVTVSPCGRWLARLGGDKHVHLYDLEIGGANPLRSPAKR